MDIKTSIYCFLLALRKWAIFPSWLDSSLVSYFLELWLVGRSLLPFKVRKIFLLGLKSNEILPFPAETPLNDFITSQWLSDVLGHVAEAVGCSSWDTTMDGQSCSNP